MTDQTPETMTDAMPEQEVMDNQNSKQHETEHEVTTGVVDDGVAADDAIEFEQDDEQTGNKPTNEAAKYRRRLRETEAERDTLKATVESLQRSEVERLAADRLSVPSDVFDLGMVTIADLVNEEGRVNPESVKQAIDTMLEARPGLAKPMPRQKYPSGIGLGNRGPIAPMGKSWQDVIGGGATTQAR